MAKNSGFPDSLQYLSTVYRYEDDRGARRAWSQKLGGWNAQALIEEAEGRIEDGGEEKGAAKDSLFVHRKTKARN